MRTYNINGVIATEQDIEKEIERLESILQTIPEDNKVMRKIYENYISTLKFILEEL